jgi:hypothetical protein
LFKVIFWKDPEIACRISKHELHTNILNFCAKRLKGMGMRMPTIEDVSHAAADLVFGKSLIQNNFRAVIAETIVGFALGADWSHCSDNWNSWDFEHKTGARLEVKQSARKQTWSKSKVSNHQLSWWYGGEPLKAV